MYRPKKPFNTQFMILVPSIKNINGKVIYTYPDTGDIINAAYTTYGGTEGIINDLYTVIDTGNVETWYRPDITSSVRLKRSDGKVYSVEGEPENIEMRNQFLKIKVRCIGNG